MKVSPLSSAQFRNNLRVNVTRTYYSNQNAGSHYHFPIAAFGIVVADCMAKKKNENDEPADRNGKWFQIPNKSCWQ